MKRWGKRLLALILVMAVCGPVARAAGETHVLEGMGIEITEPEGDYYILYRGMDPNSPALAAIGMTAQQADESLEAQSLYLVAVARDGSYEIRVSVLEGEAYRRLADTCRMGKQSRYQMSVAVAEGFMEQGIPFVGAIYWYEGGDVPYMMYELAPTEDRPMWSYQLQTIYHGRAVGVYAVSAALDGPTDYIREETRRVAQHIHFPGRNRWVDALAVFWDDIPSEVKVIGGLLVAGIMLFVFERLVKKRRARAAHEDPWERTGRDDL